MTDIEKLTVTLEANVAGYNADHSYFSKSRPEIEKIDVASRSAKGQKRI